jgi:hypothetical protein
MLDAKQLKRQCMNYARTLQTAVNVALTFSAEHPACEGPVRQSFERMNTLLKQVGQFTIGFLDRQVLINQLLTIDRNLARLANDFLQRGIGAVSFEAGLTLARYKQVIAIISSPQARPRESQALMLS